MHGGLLSGVLVVDRLLDTDCTKGSLAMEGLDLRSGVSTDVREYENGGKLDSHMSNAR